MEARLATGPCIAGHTVPSTFGWVLHWWFQEGDGVQVGHWELFAKGMGRDGDRTGWCFVSVEQSCMVCDVTGLVAFTMVV